MINSKPNKPRRPLVNRYTILALAEVRACAQGEADVSDMSELERGRLRRGIKFIDELRAWFEARHGEVRG